MDTKTVKKVSDIALEGVTIELERTDDRINGVTFRDSKGGALFIRYMDYGMHVLVPAPPPTVTRYRIAGAIKKVKFDELFENEYEASVRRNELDLTESECPIEKVQVPE